ncbi:hypothetical protein AMTRI_Chr08g206160 [Amborella trichopoda]
MHLLGVPGCVTGSLSTTCCLSSAKIGPVEVKKRLWPRMIKLKAIEATEISFQEFGQVIEPSPDGQEFGPHDAQLELHRGIPRFYIMHVEDRPFRFSQITHHASVTQCLGSIGGQEWYLGVAKASLVDRSEVNDDSGSAHCQIDNLGMKLRKAKSGHYYLPPLLEDVRIFLVDGPKCLKLNRGTWHAGPLFRSKTMDFYNMELSNTNVRVLGILMVLFDSYIVFGHL